MVYNDYSTAALLLLLLAGKRCQAVRAAVAPASVALYPSFCQAAVLTAGAAAGGSAGGGAH
jgi:hypothetical protein